MIRAIKDIENIKLKHLAKMERTGRVRQLLMWYNIFPLRLFTEKLLNFVKEIYRLISEGKSNDNSFVELEKAEWQVISALNIQEIESCLLIVYQNLDLSIRFDHLISKFKLTRRQRRKIKPDNLVLLGNAIKKIKVLTEIEIKDKKNIEAVRRDLILRKDRYNEAYNKKTSEEKKEKATILNYALDIVLYAGGSGDNIDEMTISTFLSFKNRANAKYVAEQKQIIEINNNK